MLSSRPRLALTSHSQPAPAPLVLLYMPEVREGREAMDARSHTFALYLHQQDPRLWQYDQAYDIRTGASYSHRGITNLLRDLGRGEQNLRGARYVGEPNEDEKPYPALWRGNSLEIILDEPKAKSTSFYLDEEAHTFTLDLFGRSFFERVERGLQRILNTPNHWLPIEPELRFLEHGPALLDYENAHPTPKSTEELVEDLAIAREGLQDFDEEDIEAILFGRFTWDSQSYDWGSLTQKIGTTQPILKLALRLGLLDSTEPKLDNFPERLRKAFIDRYGLDRLAPERALAYQVIRHSPLPELVFVTNAVDFHLLRLFQAYALQVLPAEQQECCRRF